MRFIEDDEALRSLAASLSGTPLLAVDTEAAGFHRYHDRVCLVQLSTRAETFVVDALAVSTLSALGPVLADPATETILHDADYDLRLLERDYDFRVAGLFDTKIVAQLIGEPAIGLGSLVEKYLGVKLDKKHQRADWAERPLPDEMLEYAADDTRHLPALRDALLARLEQLGRRHWAEEEFRLLESADRQRVDDGEAFRRVKNTSDLAPRQLAGLRELFAWREEIARERDVAPFRVVPNDALAAVARALPAHPDALRQVAGLPSRIAARHREALVQAVRSALALPESDLPQPPPRRRRPPPDPEFDRLFDLLRGARDRASSTFGLDRGVLMPRQQLELIARAKPRDQTQLQSVDGIRSWQIEVLGEPILALVTGQTA